MKAEDLGKVMDDKSIKKHDAYGRELTNWDYTWYMLYEEETPYLDIDGVGRVEVIEINTAYVEEYTKNITMIVRLDNQYFRKYGVYMSFDGANMDGAIEEVVFGPVVREEWHTV